MYPSSKNNGFNTTFSGTYYNESNHSGDPHQDHYHTPSSSSSYLLPSPIYIPFPIEDEAVFCDFFRQQQFFSTGYNYENNVILTQEMTTNGESPMGECSDNNGQVAMNDIGDDDQCDFNTRVEHQSSSPGKRASKRDRHSKINTARGPRDRRMRLSLDVAKKLFGLQDLLGLDKASKTVDWLLTQSKTAILELLADQSCSFMDVSNSASSTSECEVLSGTGDQSVVKAGDDQETTKNKQAKCSSGTIKKQKERTTRVVRRCADFHHPVAKASRERARERARERTLLKKNNKQSGVQDPKVRPCSLYQPMADQDINKLGSWIAVDESQHQSVSQFDQISSNFEFKQGFVGDNSSLLMSGNWSPSSLFNIQQTSGRTHEMIGKAWESNNN